MDRLRPLWDFDDLDLSERRFTEQLDREADSGGRAEVLTQLARIEGLRGAFDRCGDLLGKAEQPPAMTRSSRCASRSSGAGCCGRAATRRLHTRSSWPRSSVGVGRRVLPRGRRGAHGGARSSRRRRLSRLDDPWNRARRARADCGLLARAAPEQPRLAAPRTRRVRRRTRGVRTRARGSDRTSRTSTRSRSRATRLPSRSAR